MKDAVRDIEIKGEQRVYLSGIILREWETKRKILYAQQSEIKFRKIIEWGWVRNFFEVDKYAKIFTLLDLIMDIDKL